MNVHEIRKTQSHKLGILLSGALVDFQKATLKEPMITKWNYFTEFQIEVIKTQIHLFRSMHLLDPWSKVWQDLETDAIKMINELTDQEVKHGNDPRGNH